MLRGQVRRSVQCERCVPQETTPECSSAGPGCLPCPQCPVPGPGQAGGRVSGIWVQSSSSGSPCALMGVKTRTRIPVDLTQRILHSQREQGAGRALQMVALPGTRRPGGSPEFKVCPSRLRTERIRTEEATGALEPTPGHTPHTLLTTWGPGATWANRAQDWSTWRDARVPAPLSRSCQVFPSS